ncbi:chromosome partitioning protein ParB [Salinimonas marina]|uniref:Chromosome partitioning protein ParB n=1 Tax=Salinimonas marina TaxID=2785918 RepID=A0A7S9DZW4_9ALTE|nr:chromosome partitioning protein ParB [Salinimonas marina]QPG06972.1 chromosome partitioning protein ParB [Salinimonas marina]
MNTAELPPHERPQKLTDWENEPSLTQLKQDYTDAKIEADHQIEKIDRWVDALHIKGSAKLAKQKGRSSIQPKLIRKQAEWRYSSLSEPFLSTPDVFNASPVTYEDKKAAEQNELVLNYQFNHHIDKISFIDSYVRAGVDEGTVIVRVGWDYEEAEVEKEVPVFSERLSRDPAFMAQLQQLSQLQQTHPQEFAQLPEDIQRSVVRSLETQQPVQVFQSGSELVTETVVKRNHPTAEVCDYNDVVMDPSAKGDFKKAKFIGYTFTTSLEELKSSGLYTNLDQIQLTKNSPLADPDSHTPDNTNFNFKDEPRKKFTAFEYWGFWDIDSSGKVKPIVATWAGETLIRLEENPFPDGELPFVVVPYLPVKNSLYGEPDGELVKDNQDVVGAVTRGMIDILGSMANGQRGTRKDALDAINRRRFEQGQDYQFNGNVDPRQAFHVQTFPEIPNSAQFMFQQQNMEAESLTGVKAFSGGLSGQALGDTATGIRGALDAASKRELGILRRLADGIVKIGRKFISMNAEFLSEEEVIRVTNEKFVAVKRDDLAGKIDLKLTISTAEEDNAKAQELAFMLQTTGPSSDPAEVRMIRAEIARLRKMPDLAKRIAEYQPQPDPLEQQKQQLEIQKLQIELAELQSKVGVNQSTAELNMARADEVSSKADLNNLDFVEQESGVKQERDIQKHGEQARSNAQLEVIKNALSPKKPN